MTKVKRYKNGFEAPKVSLPARYTVQRISKKDKLFGKVHGSVDARETICGKEIDENWFILTADFEEGVTCEVCKKGVVVGCRFK